MKSTAFLLLIIMLGGCQTSSTLSKCGGRPFGLNPSHWQPDKADIKAWSSQAGN